MYIPPTDILEMRQELFSRRVGSSICGLVHSLHHLCQREICDDITVEHTEIEGTVDDSGEYRAYSHIFVSRPGLSELEIVMSAHGLEMPYLYSIHHDEQAWFEKVNLDGDLPDIVERFMQEIVSRFTLPAIKRGRFLRNNKN